MTGTSSRTATASPRGGVGRKLKAKPRPEEYELHTRRPNDGRGGVGTRSPMSSRSSVVYAAGSRGEGHASYPGRSACLLYASVTARWSDGDAEVSRGREIAMHCDEGPNLCGELVRSFRCVAAAPMVGHGGPMRQRESGGRTTHGPRSSTKLARHSSDYTRDEE